MKKLIYLLPLFLIGCNSDFNTQQFHFDKNMALCDSLGKITNKYLDSTEKYTNLYISTQKDKDRIKALSFSDSTKKYNSISRYINIHTDLPK